MACATARTMALASKIQDAHVSDSSTHHGYRNDWRRSLGMRHWPVVVPCLVIGLVWLAWVGGDGFAASDELALAPDAVGNAYFTPAPSDPLRRPKVTFIPLPEVPGTEAIWGATGRDHEGHIWCGLSAASNSGSPSAHLIEYIPDRQTVVDHGDVLSQLRMGDEVWPGEHQPRIQSRIVEGDDQCMYFASMDIAADYDHGPWFSDWSSHLWRVARDGSHWERLTTVPSGIMAVATAGPWLYAVGYPCHRLYQYHIPTGRLRSVRVGDVIGHASWNFLVDYRGHAYVPRLQYPATTPCYLRVDLVEYDTSLYEVAATPLPDYCGASPQDQLGIAGVQPLPGGQWMFVTHTGAIYAVRPLDTGPAEVRAVGRFRLRSADSFVSGLFAWGNDGHLLGIGTTGERGVPAAHDWLIYDMRTGLSTSFPLDFVSSGSSAKSLAGASLFGSITRDAAGRFYVGGRSQQGRPLLLQIEVAESAKKTLANQGE